MPSRGPECREKQSQASVHFEQLVDGALDGGHGRDLSGGIGHPKALPPATDRRRPTPLEHQVRLRRRARRRLRRSPRARCAPGSAPRPSAASCLNSHFDGFESCCAMRGCSQLSAGLSQLGVGGGIAKRKAHMLLAPRYVNGARRFFVRPSFRRSSYVGVALLICVGCSSDANPPDGASGASGYAGSGPSSGASNLGGAAGHAGSMQSGAPGKGGSSGTGGDTSDPCTGKLVAAGCGISGADGAAGTGSAGIGGLSSGGASSGAGGASSGAGASSGGGGATSGAGGASGIGGAVDTGGVAGTGGGASGSAGVAGAGGAQQGSFTLSTPSLNFLVDSCPFTRSFTITNTSSSSLTWQVSGDLSAVSIVPTGSTLPAGGAVSVSVTPKWGVKGASPVLSIDADIAPSQPLALSIYISGYYDQPPADIDFGNVPVPGYSSVFISAFTIGGSFPGLGLGSINPAFGLSGFTPAQQSGGFGWTLTFHAQTLGPQQTTLQIGAIGGTVCPPNTFIARAVGVAP